MTSDTTSAAVEAMARAPLPIPKGGFLTNEDEARWLEQTLVMRIREGLSALGVNANPQPKGLYDLLLLSLQAASKRAAGSLHPGIAEVIAGRAVVVPRKLLTEAHACMRATGWQLAPAVSASDDGVIELAVAEVEESVRELLASPYAPPAAADGGTRA